MSSLSYFTKLQFYKTKFFLMKLTIRARLFFVLWNNRTLAEEIFQAWSVSSQGIIRWHKPIQNIINYFLKVLQRMGVFKL